MLIHSLHIQTSCMEGMRCANNRKTINMSVLFGITLFVNKPQIKLGEVHYLGNYNSIILYRLYQFLIILLFYGFM